MATTSSSPRAVIVGLGRTGVSCARHLLGRGWRIAGTDSRETPPGLGVLRELAPQAQLCCGGFAAQLLDDAALVVASPGVSLHEPIFIEARARGIEIAGDIELFARAARAPVVGITGTNGKSTVTTLLGRMAARAGRRVRVGGNLGEPALDLLGGTDTELYVLELSSFQLETIRSLEPEVAAVLNVSPDHLDRYASVADYAAAKARLPARARAVVVNLDDPLVTAMPHAAGARVLSFSLRRGVDADYTVAAEGPPEGWQLTRRGEPLVALRDLRITGLHNAGNALAALALGEVLGLPPAPLLEELREFPGLAHRAQWVAEVRGVRYVNDSKGTNVGATLAAVAGFPEPLVIIAGGAGKGQDFSPLAPAFRGHVRRAVLIGHDAPAIARVLEGVCELELCTTLEEAVRAAARAARAGDTVLLSPACASLDMFRDYEHRGAAFSAAVRELAA